MILKTIYSQNKRTEIPYFMMIFKIIFNILLRFIFDFKNNY